MSKPSKSKPKRYVVKKKSRPAAAGQLVSATTAKEKRGEEIKRLNAVVAELTSSEAGGDAKTLYLDDKALANRWSMSVKYVQRLRQTNTGPRPTFFGRSVRYSIADVEAYEMLLAGKGG